MKLDGFMWLPAQNRTSIENGKNLCHQYKPREEEFPEKHDTHDKATDWNSRSKSLNYSWLIFADDFTFYGF